MAMKNFNDIIGNRTRDLQACSAVPQPIPPPRAPQTVEDDNVKCRGNVGKEGERGIKGTGSKMDIKFK